ncbi:LysE family translocator [Psychromarinibacter sp. C21-152]|uniref:LysE family translocator n=1 Tax=Psychromarinibacter sediminicola TaxID=3033385 RepID=A0AAE3NUW1_9RHOB|nr:LysE family translocator [Psychromarinibacter sediminicola]MDF0601052.1 LysE family translocator [Psychromarinibacter sediminicola]
MIDPLVLLAFVPAALALNLTPGADMMVCIGQGLRRGPAAAWAASGGVALGVLTHGLLAGLGLGALVAASPWLFDAIRWAGVAYLLWLAVQTLRAGPVRGAVPERSGRAFREALVVNLTNPKVILFVLAFVPQFVDPAGAVLPQFLTFAAVLALGGFVVNGLAGVFAGGIGRRLARSGRVARGLGWVSAGIFAALAVRLAVMERA